MRILGNTWKEDLNAFLKANALWICLIIVSIIIATIVIIFVVKNKKTTKKEVVNELPDDEWINALGGRENINDLMAMGSRLSVALNNQELIDREKLSSLGVSNIMVMSNKVTLIIEDRAEEIANKINKLLK